MITTDLTGDTPATMRLAWRIDEHARAGLEEEIFGKRVLVTDHDDWPLIAQRVAVVAHLRRMLTEQRRAEDALGPRRLLTPVLAQLNVITGLARDARGPSLRGRSSRREPPIDR